MLIWKESSVLPLQQEGGKKEKQDYRECNPNQLKLTLVEKHSISLGRIFLIESNTNCRKTDHIKPSSFSK